MECRDFTLQLDDLLDGGSTPSNAGDSGAPGELRGLPPPA